MATATTTMVNFLCLLLVSISTAAVNRWVIGRASCMRSFGWRCDIRLYWDSSTDSTFFGAGKIVDPKVSSCLKLSQFLFGIICAARRRQDFGVFRMYRAGFFVFAIKIIIGETMILSARVYRPAHTVWRPIGHVSHRVGRGLPTNSLLAWFAQIERAIRRPGQVICRLIHSAVDATSLPAIPGPFLNHFFEPVFIFCVLKFRKFLF
jgi:hypothetical protein